MSKDLDKLRRLLRSEDVDDVYDALIDIGKGGLTALQGDVASLLPHHDPVVRGAAIRVLGFYWQQDGFLQTAEEMLRSDPDEEVRANALMAWAAYYAGTRDTKVMRRLDQILRDPGEAGLVRAHAYPALLSVGALPKPEWPRETDVLGNIEGRVDWALVERVLQGG